MSPKTRVLVICSEIERSTRTWARGIPITHYHFSRLFSGSHKLVLFAHMHDMHDLLPVAFGCLYYMLYLVGRLAKPVVHTRLCGAPDWEVRDNRYAYNHNPRIPL